MPTTLKTRGIIIAEEPCGDYGLYIRCYTKDAGLITIRGAGMKKLTARLRSSVLPGNISYLTLVKQNGWLVTGAKVIKNTALTLAGYVKFALTSAVREVVRTIIPEEVRDDTIFELLERYIIFMSNQKISVPMQRVATYRTIALLLSSQGFAVAPDHCALCGDKLTRNSVVTYGEKRGFLCTRCVENLHPAKQSHVVSSLLFRYLTTERQKPVPHLLFSEQDLETFSSIVSDMYEVASERELSSFIPLQRNSGESVYGVF